MSFDTWRPKAGGAGAGPLAPRYARVVLPEEQTEVTSMVWRQAGPEQEGARPAKERGHDPGPQLLQMQQQCDQRVAEARAAGLREGEAAARARAAAEVQPVLEKLARCVEDLAQIRVRLRKQAEADTVKLSLAIARRVLRRELSMDADAMRGLAIAALEKLQAQEIFRVRVHPAHAAALTALLGQAVSHASVEVIPDGSLQPGGIVFETNQGNLDASVDSQLQEIERGLADHLRKQS